jgi:hypothetical protein
MYCVHSSTHKQDFLKAHQQGEAKRVHLSRLFYMPRDGRLMQPISIWLGLVAASLEVAKYHNLGTFPQFRSSKFSFVYLLIVVKCQILECWSQDCMYSGTINNRAKRSCVMIKSNRKDKPTTSRRYQQQLTDSSPSHQIVFPRHGTQTRSDPGFG